MRIIDAQIHLWHQGVVVPPHRTQPYELDEALADMDAAGVAGAILHPPSWDPNSNAQTFASNPDNLPASIEILDAQTR